MTIEQTKFIKRLPTHRGLLSRAGRPGAHAVWTISVSTISVLLGLLHSTASSQETKPTKQEETKQQEAELSKIARISFKEKNQTVERLGEILVESLDGGKLFLTADGRLRTLEPSEIISTKPCKEPLTPLTCEEVADEIRQELPPGFLVHKTLHFVLIYNTSETYARWVGDLYERLYRALTTSWTEKGFKLVKPRFPMVALVFDTREAYLQYAVRDIGEQAKLMIGYYDMMSNRIVTFDITGVQGLAEPGRRYSSQAMLNTLFSQPQAERTVATVVHEAVHQIAYNTGLQVRLGDNPKWVSEGLAMYCEAPDVNNPRGWGTIGKKNYHQLTRFAQFLRQRPADSLSALIANNDRFVSKDLTVIESAYSESWALTYFLFREKNSSYVAYLKEMSIQDPLVNCTDRQRVELFKKHFGNDLAKLDLQFINFMKRLR